jgi:hypothetical protein
VTLVSAIGYGVVRDYDGTVQCRVASAMCVVIIGPFVVTLITMIVAFSVGIFAGGSGSGGGGGGGSGGGGVVVTGTYAAVATTAIMFLGFLGCLAYYGVVFLRFCRETLELIPRSQLSHQQQADFTAKFRIFRLSAILCVVIITLGIPANVRGFFFFLFFLLIAPKVALFVLGAPPLAAPLVNIFSSLAVLGFGAVMAWTYMLRRSSFVAAEVQHHTLHEDNDF